MVTLREYKTKDWSKINDAVEPFMFHNNEFNRMAKRGVAVTAVEDGNVMVCGGVALVSEDEGVVWVKVSKKCLNQSIKYARGIKEVFKYMTDSLGSITIVTYILENFCKGERMAKLIGMKKVDKTYKFRGKMYNKFMVVT